MRDPNVEPGGGGSSWIAWFAVLVVVGLIAWGIAAVWSPGRRQVARRGPGTAAGVATAPGRNGAGETAAPPATAGSTQPNQSAANNGPAAGNAGNVGAANGATAGSTEPNQSAANNGPAEGNSGNAGNANGATVADGNAVAGGGTTTGASAGTSQAGASGAASGTTAAQRASNAGQSAFRPAQPITSLGELKTGQAGAGMVGSRVELNGVPVEARAGTNGFWIGNQGQRVFVWAPQGAQVQQGKQVDVQGRVAAVPNPEWLRTLWGLNARETRQVEQQQVYIAAERPPQVANNQ